MPTYASTANFDLSIDDIAEEAFERCGLQVRSGYDLKYNYKKKLYLKIQQV